MTFAWVVVSFARGGGDLCEADDGKLGTARFRMPQLPPCFSETSHAAKTVFFLSASLLKVKTLQPSPLNFVKRPEVGDNAFCERLGH